MKNKIDFNTKSKESLELLEIRTNSKDCLTSKRQVKRAYIKTRTK